MNKGGLLVFYGVVGLFVGMSLSGLVMPASADEVPVIRKGQVYYFYDATAGFASTPNPPFSDAAFDLATRRARAWSQTIRTGMGTWATAWVGKTVQIAEGGTYAMWWWGDYNGIVSACGLSAAEIWFHIRLLDVTKNEVVMDYAFAHLWTTLCWAHGEYKSFNVGQVVRIDSSRANHQFNLQVQVRSYTVAALGTAFADAWAPGVPRGISYWKIMVGPYGGGGCVASRTGVLLADGNVRDVDRLKTGDRVMGYDLATSSMVPVEVTSNRHKIVTHVLDINDGLLVVTPTDQPLYARDGTWTGWVMDPQNIRVGMGLFSPVDETWTEVVSVLLVPHRTKVYDLRVTQPTTFIANGILTLDKPVPI